MPVFEEDPSHLSKARLKLDLIAHNVALPPAKSKKEAYVELHTRHLETNNAANFSSDEEPEPDIDQEKAEDTKMLDPSSLTDDDLKAALLKHGVKAGPIVASTRAIYEKKLKNIFLSSGHDKVNGADEAVLYSDSEKEEENSEENEKPDTEGLKTAPEPADQSQQENSQRACDSKNGQPSLKRNVKNVLKSSQHSQAHCTLIPIDISSASSVDQRSGLATGGLSESQTDSRSCLSSQTFSITQMVEEMSRRNSDPAKEISRSNVQDLWSRSNREPVQETFKDFLDKATTPTGIHVTRRRPIKGAAQRPVQYKYPDSPVSPTTLERQEVERRLVPTQIQLFVFFTVTLILYLIYVCVEDNSFRPLLALLDSLNQGLDIDDPKKQNSQEFSDLQY